MLREKVTKLTKLLFAGATMALCVATVNPAVQVQAGWKRVNRITDLELQIEFL